MAKLAKVKSFIIKKSYGVLPHYNGDEPPKSGRYKGGYGEIKLNDGSVLVAPRSIRLKSPKGSRVKSRFRSVLKRAAKRSKVFRYGR